MTTKCSGSACTRDNFLTNRIIHRMQKKHYLVFATNFKNENSYLAEWLNYHIIAGVDHFYLYDQDGGEEARKILEPYEKASLVTRHAWTHYDGTRYDGPTRSFQINKNHLASGHCARNYRSNCGAVDRKS